MERVREALDNIRDAIWDYLAGVAEITNGSEVRKVEVSG
jgi:hypothetical protein